MIRLSVFDETEVEAIHQASLRILWETGVILSEPKSLALLTDAGARIQESRSPNSSRFGGKVHRSGWKEDDHPWQGRGGQDSR